ncbi:MAG: ABC transporter substrate-binding protein [Candidatus Scatosoma sp.]
MKHTAFFKAASLTLAAAAGAACFAGCGGNNYADKNTEYYIGASGPLSESAAAYGIAVQRGAELAVEEINAKNEDGMKFSFTMKDDKASPKDVPANFASMYESGMQLSLGCVTSGACLEFKNLAVEKELFMLCPSATADDVTKDADTVYQMCFSDSNQGSVAAEQYFNTNEVPSDAKLGILYCSNDAYSTGILKNFKSALDKTKFPDSQIKEASFQNDASGNPPTDLSSQVESLKDCNYFFMPIYYTPAATFMTAAQSKVTDDAVFFGCDGFDGIDTAIQNFDINSIKQQVSMLSHFSATSSVKKVQDFVNAFSTKYKTAPIQFAAAAYDCVYAMYEGIKTAKANGKEVPFTISAKDMSAILCEVFQSESFSYSGVTTADGTATWKADGTVNKKAEIVIIKAKNAA